VREAARIDGVTAWQEFRYVTFPMLRPVTFFVVVMSIAKSFQVFGQVYVMTPPKFDLHQLANAQGFLGGVAVDRNHNVYVCNASGHRVNRVTQKGEISIYCDEAPDGP
jgi:ABC-type glycerol-3-phosphate transport system permease component